MRPDITSRKCLSACGFCGSGSFIEICVEQNRHLTILSNISFQVQIIPTGCRDISFLLLINQLVYVYNLLNHMSGINKFGKAFPQLVH